MLNWWRHRYVAGVILVVVGPLIVGVALSIAATGNLPTQTTAQTRTLHSTTTQTRLVTIHVRGRVIRRHDHILVVLVPRTIFRTRTVPRHRIIVPKHVVRIHQPPSVFGETSAVSVIGVAPPPVTVTMTEMVPVPGPTTTVTEVQTVTETTTEPAVTVTVTLPLNPGGSE